MTEREALKLALEALESCGAAHITDGGRQWYDEKLVDKAIAFAEEALAQPEPVAVWELFEDGWDSIADPEWMETLPVGTKLYTTPPQRKPLTHEQRVDLLAKFEAHKHEWHAPAILIDMVEAAHGIGEKK